MQDKLHFTYLTLRITFGLVPVVAGLDKFTSLLTDWGGYFPAIAADLLPVGVSTFMMIVGVIEIVAGLTVLFVAPRLGAYVVMAWLLLIALTVAVAGHLDIAVRDVVMAVGAHTLAQVAAIRGEPLLPLGHTASRTERAHAV